MANSNSDHTAQRTTRSETRNGQRDGAPLLTTEQWNRLHSQLKQRWGQLNDQELLATQADFAKLTTFIQQQTGESREQIEHELWQLIDREPESEGSAGAGSASG